MKWQSRFAYGEELYLQKGIRLFASVLSAAISGMEVCPVQVEADVSSGLPCFTMVGFPNDVEEVYFDEGNIIQKVRSIIPILIPLFASSFKRADALAIAMEARGYQGGEGRTKYRRLLWNCRDTLSIIAILALGLILFYLKS